jgi:hypothetical protein
LTAPPEPDAPPPEGEVDEALSHPTSQFTPEQQAIFNKRLGKEVAKRKAAEAELTRLKGLAVQPQVPPPPPVVVTPTPEQPLANVTDGVQLQKVVEQTRDIRDLALEALDTPGVDVNGAQIGDKVYTQLQLKNIVRNATRSLEREVPARATFLAQRDQQSRAALQAFPALGQPGTPEHQMAQAIFRNPAYAYLHHRTDALHQVGLMIEGDKAIRAKMQAATKPATKPVVPARAPVSQAAFGGANSPVRTAATNTDAALAGEMKKLSGKGGVTGRDLARFLSQKDQLLQTR